MTPLSTDCRRMGSWSERTGARFSARPSTAALFYEWTEHKKSFLFYWPIDLIYLFIEDVQAGVPKGCSVLMWSVTSIYELFCEFLFFFFFTFFPFWSSCVALLIAFNQGKEGGEVLPYIWGGFSSMHPPWLWCGGSGGY